MEDEEKSRLSRLEEHLYSRKSGNFDTEKRSEISKPEFDVEKDWKGGEEPLEQMIAKQQTAYFIKTQNPFKKILWGSIAFFIIALAAAGFMFFTDSNTVSANKIDISVIGPTNAAAGEGLSLEVIIKNQNNTDLEGASLSIEYPPGSRMAENTGEELLRQREPIGNIPAGGESRRTIKAVLFGEKESIQIIKMTLEYRIKGSNAIFFKDKEYDLAIKSSPVIVTIEGPREVNSGQDVDLKIIVSSNTSEVLKGLLMRAEYPFGFSFLSSEPQAVADNSLWKIGDLSQGDRRTINIKGRMQGQNEEERTFRFYLGIASEKDDHEIGSQIISLIQPISIKKPFIDLILTIDGDSSPEYTAEPGQKIQVNVIWTNNLQSKILNGKIEVKLSGSSLDRNSVSPRSGGFFRSSDNTIVWDQSNSPDFAEIAPGGKGIVSFVFNTLASPPSGQNQDINIETIMTGSQVLPSGPPQNITSVSEKVIKLASNLNLSTRLVYSVGPLENMGPIPPKAEQETTYTVIWNVTNTLNDAANVKVTTTLPNYVAWSDLSTPSSEDITFNSVNREIVWNVGEVRAGTGFASPSKEVAFRVSFTPSLSQVGSIPNIVMESFVTGEDKFTGKSLSSTKLPLTTRLTTDPNFTDGDETVVR